MFWGIICLLILNIFILFLAIILRKKFGKGTNSLWLGIYIFFSTFILFSTVVKTDVSTDTNYFVEVLSTITKSIKVLGFEFPFALFEEFEQAHEYLLGSYIISLYALVVAFLYSIFILIFGYRLKNAAYNIVARFKGADYLIGEDPHYSYYLSDAKKAKVKVVQIFFRPLKNNEIDSIVNDGYGYLVLNKNDFFHKFKFLKNKIHSKANYNFIALDNSIDVFDFLDQTNEFFKDTNNDLANINFHLEINNENYNSIKNLLFENFSENSHTSFNSKLKNNIHLFNHYKLLANSFTFHHPITEALDSSFIDYNTASIKENRRVNIFYIGYGDVLKNINYSSHILDILPKYENGKLTEFSPNYYICDNDEKRFLDKNESFYYNRLDEFRSIIKENKEEANYFSIPLDSNKKKTILASVESEEFVKEFSKAIKPTSSSELVHNRVFVSIGDDITNLDIALKLYLLFKLNNITHYEIFIKTKSYPDDGKLLSKYTGFLKNNNIITFGSENIMYSREEIINPGLEETAKCINEYYNKASSEKSIWNEEAYYKNENNYYAALHLPIKLNLLGYSMEKITGNNDLNLINSLLNKNTFNRATLKEYKKTYFKQGSLNDLEYENALRCITYSDILEGIKEETMKASISLMFIEHSRWNRFYSMNGFIPMNKNDIKLSYDENTSKLKLIKESQANKTHACLTTYEGLEEYHSLVRKLYYDFYLEHKDNELALHEAQSFETYQYDYMYFDSFKRMFKEENSLYKLKIKK